MADEMEYIGFEIDKKLKAKFEKVADADHRSLAGELRHLIEMAITEFDGRDSK